MQVGRREGVERARYYMNILCVVPHVHVHASHYLSVPYSYYRFPVGEEIEKQQGADIWCVVPNVVPYDSKGW